MKYAAIDLHLSYSRDGKPLISLSIGHGRKTRPVHCNRSFADMLVDLAAVAMKAHAERGGL